MYFLKTTIRKWTPGWLISLYHYAWALLGAVVYRFPSRNIQVVAVTGTNGKTTVTELVNAILQEAGYTTALANSFRFSVAGESRPNTKKMTMPGRLFLQKFLRQAVKKECAYAILEMTSEGARQHRHAFIELNALIFTNLTPEHIESHGSFEAYRDAKRSIARAIEHSGKENTVIVANADDEEGKHYLSRSASTTRPYTLKDAEPYTVRADGLQMTLEGETITSPLRGVFNVYNILAAALFARTQDVSIPAIKRAVESFSGVRGRVEHIEEGQDFSVVVDYAHTPDALTKLYEAFNRSRKICVLGAAGGGRDRWKRPELGRIASRHCEQIILTNEDPYDEDPDAIVQEVAEGIEKPHYQIIMDRRKAIRTALSEATSGDAVLITGKGTDPYIMEEDGKKTPWDDAAVAREELKQLRAPE